MRKLMSLALALVMSLALAAPAAAADVGTSGNAGAVPVTISAEATTFSVTVPTSIPLNVDANAAVTCATNLSIINNTAASVEVTNIEVQSGTWSIVDYNGGDRSTLAAEKVNSNKLGLALKPAGGSQIATSGTGTQSLSVDSAEWVVSAGGSLSFQCAGIATAVSGAIVDAVQVAKVVFTIGWSSYFSEEITFTINDVEYTVENGTTWGEFLEYNSFNGDGGQFYFNENLEDANDTVITSGAYSGHQFDVGPSFHYCVTKAGFEHSHVRILFDENEYSVFSDDNLDLPPLDELPDNETEWYSTKDERIIAFNEGYNTLNEYVEMYDRFDGFSVEEVVYFYMEPAYQFQLNVLNVNELAVLIFTKDMGWYELEVTKSGFNEFIISDEFGRNEIEGPMAFLVK